MLRVGLLGAGRIGRIHGGNVAAHPKAQLVAVADAVLEASQTIAAETNATVATIDGIIEDDKIDAVLICTPTDMHADLIERAARAGKAVFCEKPVDLAAERTFDIAVQWPSVQSRRIGVLDQAGGRRDRAWGGETNRTLCADLPFQLAHDLDDRLDGVLVGDLGCGHTQSCPLRAVLVEHYAFDLGAAEVDADPHNAYFGAADRNLNGSEGLKLPAASPESSRARFGNIAGSNSSSKSTSDE